MTHRFYLYFCCVFFFFLITYFCGILFIGFESPNIFNKYQVKLFKILLISKKKMLKENFTTLVVRYPYVHTMKLYSFIFMDSTILLVGFTLFLKAH